MNITIKDDLKNNRYDYLIMMTIVSVIFAGPLFGAFIPTRIIGFLFLLYYIIKIKVNYRIKKLTYCLYGVIFYSFLAVFWISDWYMYTTSFLSLLCYIGAFFLIYYSSFRASKPIDSILKGWLFFTIANLVVAIWEVFTGQHTAEGQFQATEYATSLDGTVGLRTYAAVTYGNYNSLSIVLILCLFMLILYWVYTNVIREKLLLLLLLLFIVAIEFINTSRGCLIALFLSFIPFFMGMNSNKRDKYILIFVLSILCVYLWYEYSDTILFLIERKTDARTGAAQDPRWILWAGGLKIAEDWLYIGSGPGSQIYEYEKADIWITYAHNLWIQALVEYGLVFTIALIYGVARLAIKCYLDSNRLLHLIGVILILCWPILTIVDEGYLKSFHWTFFASILAIYHLNQTNQFQISR